MGSNGGYIGFDATPTGDGNAPGIWGMRDVYLARRRRTWYGDDPYLANVVALLHFDGADGATSIVDETGRSWARTGTGATIRTAQAKFGPSSLHITDVSSDFNTPAGILVSTDLFTVEGWFYLLGAPFTGANNDLKHALVTQGAFTTAGGFGLSINDVTKTLYFDFRGGTNGDGNISGVTTVSLNTWYHFAVSWNGTHHRGFLNGNLEYTVAKSFGWKNTGQPMRIGRNAENPSSWDSSINGYIDEVRITKGVARYTANFTPPSAPYPNP